ncbi:MAG: 50S ribosomal protein L13 [Candidatus Calescibacterium sp.]|nr:50S ribosomal protein L13 [Candidatus Calescibacterium sp.]MCX7734921.1 50S ribosomal protein L13 [bacterium]MDW8087774.1 50S ribosomal protein L13 [Candidatus Calescibacterium sp.]
MYNQATKFLSKEKGYIQRNWYLVDAKGKVLGRIASKIALILQGKHKPVYTPNQNMGDFVVVINSKDVVLTGKKWQQKIYRWHTGYPGGLKEFKAAELMRRDPTRLIYLAVKGMLPKNFQRKKMLKRLKIYPGPEHPHKAQKPQQLGI